MDEKTKLGSVDMTVSEGIATITFFHPAHNSLPGNLLSQMTETITAAGQNDEVKVVVLKSGGDRTFCAGASFDELISISDFPTGKQFFMGFARVINAMRTCPKFIIGRVQGKTVGGGVGLASATDYCLATQWASIKLSELAIGIGPFVVGPAVSRKVGTAAMQQLAIHATQWQSAEWGYQKGLYAEVFDTIGALDAAVLTLARELAASNPEAMRQLKKVFWEGTEHWNQLLEERAATSGQLVLSDFTVRAIQKFKAKAN